VVLSLSWRSCSKRSAVKLSVREPVSSEVFRSTPSFLRQRRFSLERSVWVVLRMSAYAGSEAKMRSGHIRFFNDRVHVRLVGVHANTNMLNLFFVPRFQRECARLAIWRTAKCPSFSKWRSPLFLAAVLPEIEVQQKSGRPAGRQLARSLTGALLRGAAGVHVGCAADFFT